MELRPGKAGRQARRPVDFFRLVFTPAMSQRVCDETNAYVQKTAESQKPAGARTKHWPPAWAKKWRALTLPELDLFLAVLFVMALSHDGPIRDFWSTHWIYRRVVSSSLMTRDRFEQIRSGLHAQDDDAANGQAQAVPPGGLKKIGVLLGMFLMASQSSYCPGPNMAIDEAMLKFTGTSAYRFDRMPKPTRIGLKMWALAESGTGYVFNAMLDQRNKMSMHDMVLCLSEAISGTNRTLYMDNLFTSVFTFNCLLANGILACGTCRAGRGLPPGFGKDYSDLKNPGDSKVMWGRFANDPSKDCHIMAASWMDSGICNGLSTKHVGKIASVQRRVQGEKEKQERPSRDLFADYNQHMCAVDIADMKRAMLPSRVRSFKWWHAVFFWILDSARINSNIMYNMWAEGAEVTVLGGRDFLQELVENLVEDAFDSGFLTSLPNRGEGVGRSNAAGAMDLCRFEGQHWPTVFESRGVCVVCSMHHGIKAAEKVKTKDGCETCNKFMHIKCFKSWHTQKNCTSGHLVGTS